MSGLGLLRGVLFAATAGAVVVSAATVLDRGPGRLESGLYLVTYAGLLALGAVVPRARVFVDARASVDDGALALTFDGPVDARLLAVARAALEAHGARGTFFFYGEDIAAHGPAVRALREAGHAVGTLGRAPARGRDQLRPLGFWLREGRADEALWRAHFEASPAFSRVAKGLWTPRVARVCEERGAEPVAWSVTLAPPRPGEDDEALRARAREAAQGGAVVRLAWAGWSEASLRVALEAALATARELGLRVEALAPRDEPREG